MPSDDRAERIHLVYGRGFVTIGLALYLWAVVVLAQQVAIHSTAVGFDTGYDGRVTRVEAGSPADAAGIGPGDVVDFGTAHTYLHEDGEPVRPGRIAHPPFDLDEGPIAVTPARAPLPAGELARVVFRIHSASRAAPAPSPSPAAARDVAASMTPQRPPPRVVPCADSGSPPSCWEVTAVPAPPKKPTPSELLLRLLGAALMLAFGATLLWTRPTLAAFAAFGFVIGANPFTFYLQLTPLPDRAWWCATVVLIDFLNALALGSIILLALIFPPRRDATDQALASGFRPTSIALTVMALSLALQLTLDLMPILAGRSTGIPFAIDIVADVAIALYGWAAILKRYIDTDDPQRRQLIGWCLVGYSFAMTGLIAQILLTYTPPSSGADTIAESLSMSGLFMVIVIVYAIVRHREFGYPIGPRFVAGLASAAAFVILPPLEHIALTKVEAHGGPSDTPPFSLLTALLVGIGYTITALDRVIHQRAAARVELAARRRRRALNERGSWLALRDRASFAEHAAQDAAEPGGLSAAALFELTDREYRRVSVFPSAGIMNAPRYFQTGETALATDDDLVLMLTARPAEIVNVPEHLLSCGGERWTALACVLREGSDIIGLAVYARAMSQHASPEFDEFEREALTHYSERAATALARLATGEALPATPAVPATSAAGAAAAELLEADGGERSRELLRSFYHRLYVAAFPNPDECETLVNLEHYLRHSRSREHRYHILLALVDGTPQGGAIFDYFPDPEAGFVEFVTVAPEQRGTGLTSQLDAAIMRLLTEDARACGSRLTHLFAETNDPFRTDAQRDSLDPFARLSWLGRLGFARVHLPYVQPALEPGKAVVKNLMLVVRPTAGHAAADIESATVLAMLRALLVHAFRIDKPEDDPHYQAMAAYACHPKLRLEDLRTYAGVPDAECPIWEVDLADPVQFAHFTALYGEIFPPSASAFTPEDIRQYVLEQFPRLRPRRVYRLTGIGRSADAPDGFLSAFTLAGCGFAGFVGLRRQCLPADVLARIIGDAERRMVQDGLGATGWYAEVDAEPPRGAAPAKQSCDPRRAREALFRRHGFAVLDVPYTPPSPPGSARPAKPTSLLYKSFGVAYGEPSLTPAELLDALEEIDRVVYLVDEPRRDPGYIAVETALRDRKAVPIRRPSRATVTVTRGTP